MTSILDLFTNNLSYNVKLARTIGVTNAVYISALCLFLNKDNRNSEDTEFSINRSYIYNISGLTKEEQIKSETILSNLKLLEAKRDNLIDKVKLNPQAILNIVHETDPDTLEKIKEATTLEKPQPSKLTPEMKRQAIANNLKKFIICSNPELLEAYKGWVDGVYANPNGFLSQKSIEIFQNQLNNYTNGDLDKALDIIKIATVGGYRDINWAIEQYEKRKPQITKQKIQPTRPVFNNEEQF